MFPIQFLCEWKFFLHVHLNQNKFDGCNKSFLSPCFKMQALHNCLLLGITIPYINTAHLKLTHILENQIEKYTIYNANRGQCFLNIYSQPSFTRTTFIPRCLDKWGLTVLGLLAYMKSLCVEYVLKEIKKQPWAEKIKVVLRTSPTTCRCVLMISSTFDK